MKKFEEDFEGYFKEYYKNYINGISLKDSTVYKTKKRVDELYFESKTFYYKAAPFFITAFALLLFVFFALSSIYIDSLLSLL